MAGDALKPSGRGSENQLKQPKCPNSEIHRTGLGVIPRCPGDGKWPLGTSTYLSLLKNIITGPVPPQIWMEQWIGISARTAKISDFGVWPEATLWAGKRLSEVRCFIIWCADVSLRPCVEFIWQKITLSAIETISEPTEDGSENKLKQWKPPIWESWLRLVIHESVQLLGYLNVTKKQHKSFS